MTSPLRVIRVDPGRYAGRRGACAWGRFAAAGDIRASNSTNGDRIGKYFKLGRDLNQQDSIALKHPVSGLLKLLYPNENYEQEAVRRCVKYTMVVRRRAKDHLRLIVAMEFYDVHLT